MTGSETAQEAVAEACMPHEPSTPLLEDRSSEFVQMSTLDETRTLEVTQPLMSHSVSHGRLTSIQDVLLRDPYTMPPPLDLSRGYITPISTPIPGCIHGAHTPISGASTPLVECHYGKAISVDSMSFLAGQGCLFETKSQLSMLSDTNSALLPICRICHMTGDESDILITPCRCAGTLQFIHNTCLMRWLEITTKKSRKPPKCELCHYQYHRHKKFKFNHWRFPRVSRQDKVLHSIFLVNLLVMIGCAIATVMCFLSDKEHINNFPRNKVELSTEEVITLSCGVLFFVSFFIAMSVQIKAKHTIYQLFVKFIMQNMSWEIDEYDKSKDSLYMVKETMKVKSAAFV